jgi:outer membrane protein assembly factor BamD
MLGLKLSGANCRSILALFLFSLSLASCGIFGGDAEDKTVGWSADKLYSEAQSEMDQGGFDTAIKYLQQLQTRYPFGRYAQQALMQECYAQWKANEQELALSACNKFIKQYPNSPNIDYVYYLRGLVTFQDDLGLFGFLVPQDLTERDPKSLRDSYDSFREVVDRFPKSKYTPDAVIRLRYLVNALAAHDVHVAAYYYRRGAFIAAIDRCKNVIINYQQAPAVEDALELMKRSYDRLDMPELRDDTARVLASNFPAHVDGKFDPTAKRWWRFW